MQATISRSRKLAVAALAGVLLGVGGCATTGDRDKLQAEIDQLKVDTSAASSDAADAKSMAQQAINTANDAKAQSDATEEKIDRMFKKSMYK